ncbi:MAG: L-histidine N(alpha)-methyltransferase [Myxococcales bacterium]|nr:L-histidine N(alpha)-methyltransferase [Myxococcales bacterium]
MTILFAVFRVDVALTEDRIAAELLQALERRALPEKFFYWSPLSVRAWLDLCAEGAYRNFSRSCLLVERHAEELASLSPPGRLEVVSLGAGQGTKDARLLDALRSQGRRPLYRPVDASIALLEMAMGEAARAGVSALGLKADFTDPEQLRGLSRRGAPPRIFLMLGGTLGAFEPISLACQLSRLMREQDLAVVDGELFAGAETLSGYANPVNARFAFAPLAALGLSEREGTLDFCLEKDSRRDGLHRVVKRFTPQRDLELAVAGRAVSFRAGERLEMSPSHKFEPGRLNELLAEAGLSRVAEFESPDRRFLMAVARRAAPQRPGSSL